MHEDLALRRREPLSTDSRLVEWQSSMPGEISLLDSKASLFLSDIEKTQT